MEQSGIRVVIVEDDPDWLRGLQSYLQKEPDIRLVGHASSGKAAVELLEKTEADVVLMDIMMSDSPEGIWAAAEIVKCSGARVIMLSSMEDKELIFDAFKGRAVDTWSNPISPKSRRPFAALMPTEALFTPA